MTAQESKVKTPSAGKDQVQEFLTQFKDKSGAYKYVEEIDQMMAKKMQSLVVDYNDLISNSEIESSFDTNPDDILSAFSGAVKEILKERHPQYAEKIQHDIRVRIANYPIHNELRRINADVIGRMTSVSGMVVRASEVKPLAKKLVYACPDLHLTEVTQETGLSFNEPTRCSVSNCPHKEFELDTKKSRFIDFQI